MKFTESQSCCPYCKSQNINFEGKQEIYKDDKRYYALCRFGKWPAFFFFLLFLLPEVSKLLHSQFNFSNLYVVNLGVSFFALLFFFCFKNGYDNFKRKSNITQTCKDCEKWWIIEKSDASN